MDKGRKKEIRETYKRTPRIAGIFSVRNTINGKMFIAASVDVDALVNRSKAELNFGSHINTALQKDWRTYGADSFEIEILDTLDPEKNATEVTAADVNELFGLWFDKLEPYGEKGYHIPGDRPKTR